MITDIISVIVFVVSVIGFDKYHIIEKYKHSPYRVFHYHEYYRLVTSGFLHGNWMHLLVNLFVFWQFGSIVENNIFYPLFGKLMGGFLYLMLILLSIVAGNIPSLLKYKDNPAYGSIGLSGAVSAVLFSYLLINPWGVLYLYFVIPVYTVVMAVLYLIYSQWASRHFRDNIDHMAHFYGALFGFFYTIAVYPGIFKFFLKQLTEGFPLLPH